MYRLLIDRFCGAGYEHYEISNFCQPGFEARHNTKYWTGEPYYGFGARRIPLMARIDANERDTGAYVEALKRGGSPIVERTQLSESGAPESLFLDYE